MVIKQRAGLLLSGTLIGASVLAAAPALAQDAKSQQQQIDDLQQKLQQLQDQMAAAKAAPAGLYNQAPAGSPMPTKAPSWLGGITVSFAGSFVEGATVFRQRNEVASAASDTPFSSLPFPNTPLYHENEWGGSAQQSRIAIKMSGDIDPTQHLKAYWESDFLGSGVTANSRESNSYNLRIRQAFVEYDVDTYHFHLVAGQAWSLLTQNKVGMLPQSENTPLTIDAQYVAGFNWARQEQARFVWDYNKTAWFGISFEAPQVAFASNSIGVVGGPSQGAVSGGLTGSTNVGSPIPPGLAINSLNACQASGLLDSTTACTNDVAPDIIEKFALDPGWGHYEVFGLERFFADEVATTAVPNSWSQKVNFGWGVGGSALVPAIPKYLDLQGSVLVGDGIGRYGSSQLPDVTIGTNGSLTPLQTMQFLVGAVAHPWDGLDVYAYAGQEQVNANFWNIGATHGGFGNPAYANNGCLPENLGSGTAGFNDAITGLTCTANVRRTQELTVGFWNNIYKGPMGRLTFGMQYEYVRLQAFAGATTQSGAATALGGVPNGGLNPNNNIFFTSIRYYPF